MPVTSQTPSLVAFPAARIRRMPARPAPARTAPAFVQAGSPAPAGFTTTSGLMRVATGAGLGAVLLAMAGLGGWGFVAAERGAQASLAGFATSSYATSTAPVAGAAPSGDLDGRAAPSMSWDRR